MSTTVIASRFGPALFVASWLGGPPSPASVGEALERHGLELLPDSLAGNEFIAAEGLTPASAAKLAADLRRLGLTVRVVNKTGITQSARVGNAFAATLMGMILTIPFGMMSVLDGRLTGLALLLIPGLFFVLNALSLASRDGLRLATAGARPEAPSAEPWDVREILEELEGELPQHQLEPLRRRARSLLAAAASDPDGPAAAELAAMRQEQQARAARAAEAEAKSLRAELDRARRAVRETR